MCVICASPKGVRQPAVSEIKRMFFRNPDGAGYMAARDGKVIIHKGFMRLDDFMNALKSEHFTARDSVERKKAMVSTSKDFLRIRQ